MHLDWTVSGKIWLVDHRAERYLGRNFSDEVNFFSRHQHYYSHKIYKAKASLISKRIFLMLIFRFFRDQHYYYLHKPYVWQHNCVWSSRIQNTGTVPGFMTGDFSVLLVVCWQRSNATNLGPSLLEILPLFFFRLQMHQVNLSTNGPYLSTSDVGGVVAAGEKKWLYWVINSDEPVFTRMNCTTLLATTQSHHLPYLDISQTQQSYFELSKDLNTIHAYGTLKEEYKCSKHLFRMRT